MYVYHTFYLRIVDDNCALLNYYATSGGNFLPTFRDNLSVPSSRSLLEDGTDSCCRNVGDYQSTLRDLSEEPKISNTALQITL
jgi:hypothetical protein